MLNKRHAVIFIVLIMILLNSCQKDKEELVILLNPMDLIINNVHPSEVVSLIIQCHSPEELKQLVITSKIEGDFSKTELDTIISGKSYYLRYEYQIPAMIESSRIILEFLLYDVQGEIATNVKVLDVIASATNLQETAGHELFSGNSAKQNAYNMLLGIPLYSHLADSIQMHIADTSDSPSLTRRWISPAGVKFVRFNGFDYANSTNISVKNGYNAGIKIEFVENLTIGDILIAGILKKDLTRSYVAIKIVNIIDATGSEYDRYIFNIKK